MPPKAHRFKPGQSGNPTGRPRGNALAALLRSKRRPKPKKQPQPKKQPRPKLVLTESQLAGAAIARQLLVRPSRFKSSFPPT